MWIRRRFVVDLLPSIQYHDHSLTVMDLSVCTHVCACVNACVLTCTHIPSWCMCTDICINKFSCVCVNLQVQVHLYVCACARMHACVLAEVRGQSWVSFLVVLHLIAWDRVSHWPWSSLIDQTSWPASFRDELLPLLPHHWDCRHMQPHLGFPTGGLDWELHSKHPSTELSPRSLCPWNKVPDKRQG